MDQSQTYNQQDLPQTPFQDHTPPTLATPTQIRSAISPFSVVGIILVIILAGAGGFFFGGRTVKTQQDSQKQIIEASSSPTNTPVLAKPKQTLKEAIAQHCVQPEYQISLTFLPFKLSQQFLENYLLADSVKCTLPVLNPMDLSDSTVDPKKGFIMLQRTNTLRTSMNTFLFHAESNWDGRMWGELGSPIGDLTAYSVLTIDGREFYATTVPSVDFGYSTRGTGVYLLAEKKDPASQSVIRVSTEFEIKDKSIIDIVKKYEKKADRYTDSKTGEIVYMLDEAYIRQFRSELFLLAPSNSAFQQAAREISADLDGIQF